MDGRIISLMAACSFYAHLVSTKAFINMPSVVAELERGAQTEKEIVDGQ